MHESPLTHCAATAPMFNFEHSRDEIRASVAALVVQLTIATRREGRERMPVLRYVAQTVYTGRSFFSSIKINPAFLGNHSKIVYVSRTVHKSVYFNLFPNWPM